MEFLKKVMRITIRDVSLYFFNHTEIIKHKTTTIKVKN